MTLPLSSLTSRPNEIVSSVAQRQNASGADSCAHSVAFGAPIYRSYLLLQLLLCLRPKQQLNIPHLLFLPLKHLIPQTQKKHVRQ